jgi:hypothetical protein
MMEARPMTVVRGFANIIASGLDFAVAGDLVVSVVVLAVATADSSRRSA